MAKPGYKSARKAGAGGSRRRPKRTADQSPQHAAPREGLREGKRQQDAGLPARAKPPKTVLPELEPRQGARLAGSAGIILETRPDSDYALIDSGNGEKLEQYGALTIRRPEGQALWRPSLPAERWEAADAIFTGDTDEEGQGRWHYPSGHLPETWPIRFDGLAYHGRFTSFRHTGVFPEQAAHWRSLEQAINQARQTGRPVRMLNLFGYTGLASLVAARAGAEVTHVDASKKAVGWAKENQALAGLEDKPIRWIIDDAVKFCAREVRRGSRYDVILLDPPAYGRGPKGEVWQLFEHLPHMLDLVRALQSKNPVMTILTAYAIRASHFALHELMNYVFAGMAGRIESGELVLVQQEGGRRLSTSMFSRFTGKEVEL
ncbi:MAG: class I SAM-dependent methyltransferase [Pseudomonadota bacterium]